MRRSRIVCLLIVLSFLAFSAFAHADGIPGDPVMQVDDPTCGGPDQSPCPIVGDNTPFTFSANATGGGATSFQVDPTAGTPGIHTLDIETLGTFASISDVQCFSNVFTCQVSFIGNNTVTDMFLSCSDCSGFSPGTIFTIDLGNLSSTDCNANFQHCPTTTGGGWQPNQAFVGQGNLLAAPTTPRIPTPEPASIFLLAAGTTALFGKKMILKR